MLSLWRICISRHKRIVISGHIIRVIIRGVVVTYSSEAEVLKVCTLCISCMNVRVNLVCPFRPHFRLTIEASLILVIVLASVVVNFLGVFLLVNIFMIVILGQSYLLVSV